MNAMKNEFSKTSEKNVKSSLQVKIVLWVGLSLIIAVSILVGYSVFTLRQSAINDAENAALETAKTQAGEVKNQLDVPLLTARTMAHALASVKDSTSPNSLTRDQVNGMLKKLLEDNPSFLGTYTLWEPNAFDNLDAQYAGTPQSDKSGRLIPYWNRGHGDGKVYYDPLADYETPGVGDWYLIPRSTKKEVTLAPLIYPIGGKDVTMASFIIPIVVNDKFYGIAGVDAPIEFTHQIVDNVNLYDGTANAVLFNDAGKLIAVRNQPDLTNQPASKVYDDFQQLQPQLAKGEPFISLSPDGNYLRVFSPIDIGESGTHWFMGLTIPFEKITAAATALAIRLVSISIGLILLALVLLWFLARQIVKPIQSLTEAASAIAGGNLAVSVNVNSNDEIGVLANAFDTMTSQLRGFIESLEQRVSARTRDLEIVSEVGTATATILESKRLLQEVVDLTKERFNLYHSHIYLLDEKGENLVLTAGAGEPGRVMVSEGRSIPLNREQSLVARAARERKGVTVNDVTQAPDFLPNPLLPETRSELAVPMIVGGNVLGVFDIQSEQVGRFTASDINIQTTLAAQLATSIQNVRSFEQSKKQAELESMVNTIGQKIQRTTTIEETLQTAIRELGTALGAPRVKASISAQDESHN